MLGPDDEVAPSSVARDAPIRSAGGDDFFSALGTEHKRKDAEDKKKVEVPKVR